jgi:putative transposase
MSGYEAKVAIVREAIRSYLAHPLYVLHPTARLLIKSKCH